MRPVAGQILKSNRRDSNFNISKFPKHTARQISSSSSCSSGYGCWWYTKILFSSLSSRLPAASVAAPQHADHLSSHELGVLSPAQFSSSFSSTFLQMFRRLCRQRLTIYQVVATKTCESDGEDARLRRVVGLHFANNKCLLAFLVSSVTQPKQNAPEEEATMKIANCGSPTFYGTHIYKHGTRDNNANGEEIKLELKMQCKMVNRG